MAASLISLTGAPGSGKTTVARMLAERLGGRLIEEDYGGNPFLAESYSGTNDFRIAAQSWFMLSRVNQLAINRWPQDGLVVADYAYSQDAVYAGLLLKGKALMAYKALAESVEALVVQPCMTILLNGSLELLQCRIAKRGRGYENFFSRDFLTALSENCVKIAREENTCGSLIEVDIDERDLNLPMHQDWLLQQISNMLGKGERQT